MTELNPSEAQRKAMGYVLFAALSEHEIDDCDDLVGDLIAAANNAPEGAPVGTIARRPDGGVVAVRSLAYNGTPFWNYNYVDPGIGAFTVPDDAADSWPVIYDPTRQELRDLWNKGKAEDADYEEADLTTPDFSRLDGTDKGAVGFITGLSDERLEELGGFPDPTAQQEPASGFAEAQRAEYARAKAEFDTIAPKSRSPRVVDRLGVDERGSRWRRLKNEYKWADGRWHMRIWGWSSLSIGYEPHVSPHSPFLYTEILEPRVLPTLDCEDQR